MDILKRPLTFRLIVYLFIVSIGFVIALSIFEYRINLESNLKKIDNSFRLFEESSVESIAVSLYYVDYSLLDIQLLGLLKLDYIEYVEVLEEGEDPGNAITAGKKDKFEYKVHSLPLNHYDSIGNTYYLGDIRLYANVSKVRNGVIRETFGSMIPKVFLVIIINITLFVMFQFILIRHLNTIMTYTASLDYSEKGTDLVLGRKTNKLNRNDELSQVVHSINNMRRKIYTDFKTISEIENELNILNKSLESKVKKQNSELEEAIDALRITQNKLVESEKLSALRGLIAGIAHEINNPVGISVTGVSFLGELSKDITEKFRTEKMKKSDLDHYLTQVQEVTSSLTNNLRRAADLVANLKKVSSDQVSGEKRQFDVGEYIEEILVTLRIKLKRTKHVINVNCPDNIIINSIPGAFGQILTNLVLNSLLHGFENMDRGVITIDIIDKVNTINFNYKDNGIGIKEENIHKVFDPFFTTKKGQGGTGLGLQIINNIVTDTLNGTLEFNSSEGKGVEFIMEIPK